MTHPLKPSLSQCLKLIRAVVKVSAVEEHKSSWHVKISVVIERVECVRRAEAVPRTDQFIRRDVRFRGPRYD